MKKYFLLTILFIALLCNAVFLGSVYAGTVVNKPSAITNTLNIGLQGWWTMDGADTNATQLIDRSGNSNDATKTGTVGFKAGKIGMGAWQNGASGASYWNVPHNNTTLDITDRITIAGWVKYDTFSNSAQHADIVTKSLGYYQLGAQINGGNTARFLLFNGANQTVDSVTVLKVNTWYHLAGTWDKTEGKMRIYVNGNLENTTSNVTTAITPQTSVVNLGGDVQNNTNTAGIIDDIRIYNRALSAKEILQLYQMGGGQVNKTLAITNTLNNGLQGWYTLDAPDVNTTQVLDKTGNGNSGTRLLVRPAAGRIGQGMDFTQNFTSKITLSTISSLSNPTGVTMSAWIFPNIKNTSDSRIMSKGNGDMVFQMNGSTNFFNSVFGGIVSSSSPAVAPVTGQWQLATMTWTAGSLNNVKFYLNGKLVGTTNNYGAMTDTGAIVIGNHNSNGYEWMGRLDDARVWNRALSAKEVLQMYQMGTGQVNKTPAFTNTLNTGLDGWWTFDGADTNATQLLDKAPTSTPHNGTRTAVTLSNGKLGQAGSFNGLTSKVDMGGTFAAYSATDPFTFSAWVKLRSTALGTVMGRSIGSAYNVIFSELSANTFSFRYLTDGANFDTITTPATVNLNQWYHVVATQDGTNTLAGRKIYLNGVGVGSGVRTGTIGNIAYGASTVQIGAENSAVFLNGLVDDVRVYNRALSAKEVLQLYQMGK